MTPTPESVASSQGSDDGLDDRLDDGLDDGLDDNQREIRRTLALGFHRKYGDDADPADVLTNSDEIEWMPFLILYPIIAFNLVHVVGYFRTIDTILYDHEGLYDDGVPSPFEYFENSEERFAEWDKSCSVLISGFGNRAAAPGLTTQSRRLKTKCVDLMRQ
ncbi:MAG: hypothetical protein M1830_010349 [Pleopsidium flavum]|nr:MAG: hypothetical protein M1830_010349 [Pleopsidium flavum]